MADDPESHDAEADARPSPDDATFVSRARAGDPDAFSELYERWFDRVLDLAYRIVWNSDAAADVARGAFIVAWRNLGELDDPGAFGVWLLRITRTDALVRQRVDQRVRPDFAGQLTMRERSAPPVEDRIAALDDPDARHGGRVLRRAPLGCRRHARRA